MAVQKTAKKTTAAFSEEERAAMKDHAQEVRTAAKRGSKVTLEEAEAEVLAKIAEFGDADRALAEQVHKVVRAAAPELMPRLWYGQPAYAKDGKVLCFFQPSGKFKTRYSTFGFSDVANLDDGNMWLTSFAVVKLTAADEKKLGALVKQAAS